MIELYENLAQKDADLCALVLKASSIPHKIRRQSGGWSIWVDERHYAMARYAMQQYFSENRAEPLANARPSGSSASHGYAGIWIAGFLGGVFLAVRHLGGVRTLWAQFGASAERINSGEVYRTVTALMLHADAAHLIGNMAGIALFGTAVCQITGWGTGTLLILATGILGNQINAVMYESAHLSIGASTAVFGALGILSGYQFSTKRKAGQRRGAAWLPLAGGLALLGLLGSGAHVDLTAHLFGFVSGVAAGIVYAHIGSSLPAVHRQSVNLILSVGLVMAAWLWGYLLHY